MSPATSALSGAQKAAVLMMNLGQQQAAEIMRQLTDDEADEITAEIVRMTAVAPETIEATFAEFHDRAGQQLTQNRGGRDFAAHLLEASFGAERAASVFERLSSGAGGNPFEYLAVADSSRIATLLEPELPETVAVVLVHLDPDTSAAVLGALPATLRVDVAQCIAGMEAPTAEALAIVATAIKERMNMSVATKKSAAVFGGVQPLVDIINRSDAASERSLLESLDERDPALAAAVRSQLLGFDDLTSLGERDVQQVLRGIDARALAVAIKGARKELVEVVRTNMSERNRQLVDDEIALLGRLRKAQVEEARGEVTHALRQLVASGAIVPAGPEGAPESEGDDDYVD